MKVRDVMTRDVETARPGDTVRQVARRMSERDTGAIPVVDGRRPIGMITDRDIVIRVVAEGRNLDTPVSEAMTPQVEFCFEDDDLNEVSDKMARLQMRRMLILDRDKNLAGIISLGDVATEGKDRRSGDTLEKISQPGSSTH